MLLLVMFAFTTVQALDQTELELQALTSATDSAPNMGPVADPNPSDDSWDILAVYDLSVTTSVMCLGVEFAYNKWYVSDGGNTTGLPPNWINILTPDCNLITRMPQILEWGWGFRDLTFDGTYLYGSADYNIYAFDEDGNDVPGMMFTGPSNPNRALAYDPATDHFWTASFSGPIYEFDRAGNVFWTGPSGLLGVYGMAWDDAAFNGPWLWIYDQSGSPASTTVFKFDPINKVFTGYSYNFPLPQGYSSNTAGGLCFTNEWNSTHWVLGALGQGNPNNNDLIAVYEMYPVEPPPSWSMNVDLTYLGGSPIPVGGGALNFDILIEHDETTPIEFDAWLDIEYQGGYPATVVKRSFSDFQPVWSINRPNMYFPVPGSWAGGDYEFFARVGWHSQYIIFDEDFFPFVKEGSDHVGFQPWVPDGLTDPFDEIIKDGGSQTISEYALHGAYPNPFNPTTAISIQLSAFSRVNLSVYDVSGRGVATLIDGHRDAGVHEAIFDGSGLASGVYIYSLQAGDFNANGKMIMMK
ncbi:T9SS type A sorting domain-containing protein [bacterium]|nr:T9SS type A sorting domain-containing protein [bacterium]